MTPKTKDRRKNGVDLTLKRDWHFKQSGSSAAPGNSETTCHGHQPESHHLVLCRTGVLAGATTQRATRGCFPPFRFRLTEYSSFCSPALNFPGTGGSADAAVADSLGSGQAEMSIIVRVFLCVFLHSVSSGELYTPAQGLVCVYLSHLCLAQTLTFKRS